MPDLDLIVARFDRDLRSLDASWDAPAALMAAVRDAFASTTPHRVEYPHDARMWEAFLIPQGDVVLALVRDVTADRSNRRLDAERLRVHEERLRAALSAAPIILSAQDRDLRYVWMDNVDGADASAMLGRTDADLIDNAEDAAVLTLIKSDVIRSGEGRREIVRVRRGGHVVFHDLAVEPMRSAEGEIVGVVCAAMDLTERVRSETALAAYADKLNGLNTAALAIHSAATLDQMIRTVTAQARAVVGAHRAVMKLAGGEEVVSASEQYDASDTRRRITATLRDRTGTHVGTIELSDRYDGDFSAEDEALLVQLSQIASVAIENTRLYETAQSAARAREEITAIVSHDLRNPLTTISTAVQLLMLDQGLSPESRDYLQLARDASSRMRRLVTDLLDVSAIEAGRLTIEKSEVDVELLFRLATAELREVATRKGVTLHVADAPHPPAPLLGDPDRLLQVLSNLLGNAVKFTPFGGRVDLAGETTDADYRFVVSDTGPGIPAEARDHIFDRYWRGKGTRNRDGAGLGLAIARGIVEAHGGTIAVDVAGGGGARFIVTLPLPRAGEGGAAGAG